MPESLAQPCLDPYSLVRGTGEYVLPLLIDNAHNQIDCKDRHLATVELYNKMRDIVNVKN